MLKKPGGFQAISRRLSEATPPVYDYDSTDWHPERCARISPRRFHAINLFESPLPYWSSAPKDVNLGSNPPGAIVCTNILVAPFVAWADFPETVGGVADHVHLLVGLRATHCLTDFMRELKKASSVWVHEEIKLRGFAWQESYAAFTVSATARDAVRDYIARQEHHHQGRTFREELVEMLERAGVDYDARYLD